MHAVYVFIRSTMKRVPVHTSLNISRTHYYRRCFTGYRFGYSLLIYLCKFIAVFRSSDETAVSVCERGSSVADVILLLRALLIKL